MVPSAALLANRYAELNMPVTIIAGSGDQIANPSTQSNRLAHVIFDHDARLVDGAGHMVHYFAPDLVIAAANRDEAASHADESGVSDATFSSPS